MWGANVVVWSHVAGRADDGVGPGEIWWDRSARAVAEVERRALAAIVYPAPHGTEGLIVRQGDGAVAFGRGRSCPIRFGFAPEADAGLPRHAGTFVVAGDRVAVEVAVGDGYQPVLVRAPGQRPIELAPGEIHAPASVEYDLIVRGDHDWRLAVHTRSNPGSDAGSAGWDDDEVTTAGGDRRALHRPPPARRER